MPFPFFPFPVVTFLYNHRIPDYEGIWRNGYTLDHCPRGDNTMMPDMGAPFDDAMGTDKNMILDDNGSSFRVLLDADAFFMGIGAIYGNEGGDVTKIADDDPGIGRIYLRHTPDINPRAYFRFPDNPDQGVEAVALERGQ